MDKLKLIKKDPYLKPYENQLYERYKYAQRKEQELTRGTQKLADFATGYLYFGMHKEAKKWVFREWAPNATSIGLIGDFNNWKEDDQFQLKK